MTEKGGRSNFFSDVPNWVSAIAASLAALAGIVFGVVELTGNDDSETANSEETTTSTSTDPQGPVPIGDADLQEVGTDIVRVRVPSEWDERRSYVAPLSPTPDLEIGRIPTHTYVATDAAEATEAEDFYGNSGIATSISADLGALMLDRTSRSDDVVASLNDLYPFGHDCEPQLSTREVRFREYQGLLRDWRECGGEGARFTDGLLFAEDGSHFVYVQLRASPYEWEAAVDEILSSIDVDVDALVADLGDEISALPDSTTP